MNQSGHFEVYRTSAGAGKTFAIVKEFIRLNLTDSKFDETVAITFTNKAAQEMKDRILEYLFGIAYVKTRTYEISALIENLIKETGKSEHEIISSSKDILTKILHNYSRFSVSTIDSFIHDILKIFSYDLKLPDNFRVEIDNEKLIQVLVSELLYSLETSDDTETHIKALTEYVINLSLNRMEEKENWDITNELKTYAKILLSEAGIDNMSATVKVKTDDFIRASKDLWILLNETVKNINLKGKEAIEAIEKEGLSEEDFYYKSRGIFGYFHNAKTLTLNSELSINTYVRQTIEENKWEAKTKKPGISKIPESLKVILRKLYYEIKDSGLVDFIPLLIDLRLRFELTALLWKMQQILNEYKMHNQILPIVEFNKYIADIVRSEPAPFIYERLGQKYRHFLIDEFQDTSILQWQNFLPLVENSLSHLNKVMLVGDVKQSIYRFRNSEMEQLLILPKIYHKPENVTFFNDYENILKNSFYDKSLDINFTNTNYRSGQYIIELNNRHFSWLRDMYKQNKSNNYIADAYENVEQHFPIHAKEKGKVCFYPLLAEDYDDATLNLILQIINSYTNKSDIAILTRSNSNAKKIATFLLKQNPSIPVVSSESLELGFSPAVNFIIDMLKFIHIPDDNIAIIGAYTYLYLYNSKISGLYPQYQDWLDEIFLTSASDEKKDRFLQLLESAGYMFDFTNLSSKTLCETVSYIINVFDLSSPTDAYILFFHDKFIEYIKQYDESILNILKWWEETGKKISIIVPEKTDAVRILSIHKAKGLQFPVVIYPFADFKLKNTNSFMWISAKLLPAEILAKVNITFDKILVNLSLCNKLPQCCLKQEMEKEILKQELDTLNIHYVAMTRAKNELHVIYKHKLPGDNEKISYINELLNRFIEHENDIFKKINDTYIYGNTESSVPSAETQELQSPVLEKYIINVPASLKTVPLFLRKSKSRKTGLLFHDFMANIHTFDNVESLLQDFIIRNNLNDEQASVLKKMVNLCSQHNIIKELFSAEFQHYNEKTIILQNNTYRPDKIAFNQQKTYLADFKTGKKSETHRQQLLNYKDLLEKMNFKNITSLLIYVCDDNPEIEVLE